MTIRWAAAALCAGLSWSACATDSRSLLWQMDRELQTAAAQPDLDPAALARLAQAGRQLQVEVRGDAALARKAAQVAALADALHARAAHPDPQRAPPVPVATGPLLHRAATSTMGASCANAIALQPEQALRVSLPAASSIWVRLSLPPGRGAGFSTRGSQADAALAVYPDCRELDQPIAAGDDDYGLQASVALAADARRATWVARVDNVGAAGEIVILGGTATQLAGRVTRAVDGSPVASIVIGAFRDYGTFLSYVGTAQTNASGDYVLSIFPGEAATYYARTGDYVGQNLDVAMLAYAGVPCSVRDWYYINSCVGTMTPIVPPLGGSVTGIDFALPPTATIAGRVRSETSGAPVFGAQVTVYDGSGNTAGYQYTDAAGRYRVLGLGGGTFYARADAPDHDSELFENIPCAFQACSPASGTPIAAAAGTTAIVDFDLVRQLLVNVNVTLEGQPLTGFLNGYLDLLNANGAPVASASIFGGTVRIGPVPPGNYYLRALPSVYQPQFAARLYPTVGCASDCFSELASATPIAISSAQGPVSVAFDLQALPRLSGRVTDAVTGAGIPNVTVRLLRPGSELAGATTGSDGTYVVPAVAPGSWYVLFAAEQHLDELSPDVPCESTQPLVDCFGATVQTFTADSPDRVLDETLAPAAAVTGRMTLGAGYTFAQVYAFGATNLVVPSTTLFDLGLGNYRLSDLPAGTYAFGATTYSLWSQLYAGIDCATTSGFSGCNFAAAQRLALATGQVRTGVSFALRSYGARRGRVLDAATMQPVAGVAIDVWTAAGTQSYSTVSASDGSFEVASSFSGDYYVSSDADTTWRAQVWPLRNCPSGSVYLGTCDVHIGNTIALPEPSVSASELRFLLQRQGVLSADGFE